MSADYRLFCFLIKVHGAHDACRFAQAAANALIRHEQNAPAFTALKGVAWAYLHTGGFKACKADYRDKAA
jgi:hypothetical protein